MSDPDKKYRPLSNKEQTVPRHGQERTGQRSTGPFSLLGPLVLIMLVTFLGMSAVEVLKQVIYPDISIWTSQIITIIFSTLAATVAGFLGLRAFNQLHLESAKEKRLRKRLEAKIVKHKNRERHLRRISKAVEQSPNSVIITDHYGIIEYVNPSFAEISGYTAEEAIGRTSALIKSGLTVVSIYRDLWNTINSGKTWRGELPYKRKDGSVYWDYVSISPIKNASGTTTHFLAIQTDITDRKHAEEALRESEARFRMMSDSAPVMIWMCGRDRLCTYFNKLWLEFRGRSMEQELANGWAEGVHPDDLEQCMETCVRAFETGEEFQREYRLRRADGKYRLILDRGVPRKSSDGNCAGFIGSSIDITERQLAEKRARELQAELAHVARVSILGEMAAGISHEVNQPLTAIESYADACMRRLQSDTPDPAKLIELLKKIRSVSQNAGEIIRRLRLMAQKKSQGLRELSDINELIRQVVELIAAVDSKTKDFRVRLVLDSHLPAVLVDPVQIQQVIWNLIRNGVDAMTSKADGKPLITIATARGKQNTAEVTVSDEGIGLSEEVTAQLFTPFFTTKEKGMGMGLVISQSILAAHNGRLWLTRNPDQGTTFHFSLPIGGA